MKDQRREGVRRRTRAGAGGNSVMKGREGVREGREWK